MADLPDLNLEDLEFKKPAKSFNFDIKGMVDQNSNSMCGLGRANYKDIIYEGNFFNNQWHGFGRAIMSDDRYYIGFFKNDRKHGRGTLVKPHKNLEKGEKQGYIIEEGEWKNDILETVDHYKFVEGGFHNVVQELNR